ncbi:uncharacterized protein F5147DRAFT_788635 [Suillus discolor]|uniref:KOW domain-containing protein n=1 Tax=Suillus discolor TaxID=1912936 RepID=A0A9P7EUF5_9AGAM|nr:uncharacterized protein F5147DRAFT_788635 [Suillus discolor]KAG2088936.1 hypothetical protein F5147DRAFT_788635 [Suillus discolor]
MSKWPASYEIAPEGSIKHVKQTNAMVTAQTKSFLDLQAQVDWEEMIDEVEDEEDDNAFVVPDDQASDNDQSSSSDPLQNEAAWDILQAFLKTDMQYDEMERQLVSYLDEQYHAEDWTEAKRVLFSGDGDNRLSLINLLALKEQHIAPAKLAQLSSGSNLQRGLTWQDRVQRIQDKYASSSTLLPVQPSLRRVPSSGEYTRDIINKYMSNKISSSHAYFLMETEFSDDSTLMSFWESVLDAVVDADTSEAKRQVFAKWTSDVEHVMSHAAQSTTFAQPQQGERVLEKPTSTQDVEKMATPDLPTWLVTVPSSKTSYLATQLKKKGFEVYTHSTLPGHFCVKAENTYVIREAWPSSHIHCYFNVLFIPPKDQTLSKPSVAIPGWYHPIRGQYWHDVGYGHSYDPESDIITILVASRALTRQGVRVDSHMPRLYDTPNGLLTCENRGKTYIHGFLALKLRRTAVVEIPIPAPDNILFHNESKCNPTFVQSTLHAYASQHLVEGDLVRVRAGEMVGCTAKIDCIDMGTHLASAYMEDSLHVEKVSPRPLMFSLVDLERKFRVGDNVCVLDHSIVASAFKGKNGIVVQIDEDTVVVHDQSSQCQFTVAIDSLATFIGDFTKKDPANVTTVIETPMKGDHVVVTEGFYACEFGEVSEVDLRTQMLVFFSESQQLRITVPIRMTAFNPNPAALRHTPERGYDLVAGDIIQVVRGKRLCASGKVLHVNLDNSTLTFEDMPHTEFTTRITYVARIGRKGDRDLMQDCIGKDVIIISGPMKSYRGTLHSLSQDKCQVAIVQGSKQEFRRSGVLLTGVRLPYKLQMDFNKLVRSLFIQSPHVTPPRTPRHSPPPEASRSDLPTDATLQSWDAPAESVLLELNRQQDLSSASQDPWTINEADKEDLQLHPANASSSSSLADSLTSMFHDTHIAGLCCNWHMKLHVVKTSPATWFNNFMDRLVNTVALDPFVLSNSLVKHGKIAIRYSSRTKNTGMKVDTIPLEFLTPEPPTGKNRKFTLIRGEFMGSVHTTMLRQWHG